MRKVLGSPVTVHASCGESRLPRAALGGAMRKQLRPRGQLARADVRRRPRHREPLAQTITRMNDGTLAAAPPRPPPAGADLEGALGAVAPRRAARGCDGSREQPSVAGSLLVLLLFLLLALPWRRRSRAGDVAAGRPRGDRRLRRGSPAGSASTAAELSADGADRRRDRRAPAERRVRAADPGRRPAGARRRTAPDSAQGPFRRGAPSSRRSCDRPAAAAPGVRRSRSTPSTRPLRALQPARAFPTRLDDLLSRRRDESLSTTSAGYADAAPAPAGAAHRAGDGLSRHQAADVRAAARHLQRDCFVPNLQLIPPNTISLMVTNPPFIEAYMVGLNHEFARELLWREYPTDQRGARSASSGTPRASSNRENLPPAELAEKIRDITRIHEWPPDVARSATHNNRPAEPDGRGRSVVLVIRGDLLKRYPNTIIYAQRARWGDDPDDQNQLLLWDETGEKSAARSARPEHPLPAVQGARSSRTSTSSAST